LLHRSSAAPHSTLPQRRHAVFLRHDLRSRADYFANPELVKQLNDEAKIPYTRVIEAADLTP
jgi:hypothetical protein